MSTLYPTGDDGIIYRRVSDPTQSGGDPQLTNLRRLARTHAVNVVAEIFDEGESGDDLTRPGLLKVEDIVERGHKHKRPVAWVLLDQSDRLSRADSLDTSELLARLRRWGVRWIATPARVFDLHSALDRTMLAIECDHKNNPYLKDVARRILDGQLDTVKGNFWPFHRVPLGYKKVSSPGDHGVSGDGRKKRRRSSRLGVDEATAPIVLEAFKRYRDGTNARGIQDYLTAATGRKWALNGTLHLLRRTLYTGKMSFGLQARGRHVRLVDGQAKLKESGQAGGDVIMIGGFPVIVPEPLFRDVQERLASGRIRAQHTDTTISPLASLCVCGVCGFRLTACRPNGYTYYRCNDTALGKAENACRGNYKRGGELLSRVLELLRRELLAGDTVVRLLALAGKAESDARQEWESSMERARQSMATCETRLANARRRLATAAEDMVSEYEHAIRALRAEQADLENQLRQTISAEPLADDGDSQRLIAWVDTARRLCETGESADAQLVNTMMREVVAQVLVFPPEKRVRGKVTVGQVQVILPERLWHLISRAGTDGGSCG